MNKASQVVDKDVLPMVRRKMVKAVERDVYGAYNPLMYTRRGKSGGLSDPENVQGRVSNLDLNGAFQYSISNITRASTTEHYLAPLIEKGQDWAKASGYPVVHDKKISYYRMSMLNEMPFTPYYNSRPFIENTRKELRKSRDIERLMKKKMNGV